MKKRLAYTIASFFGSGFFPYSSGTFGSLTSFIAIVPLAYFWGILGILSLTIIAFIIGWLASTEVLKYTQHDPSLIVIDETAGQTITFLFTASLLHNTFSNYWLYITGFFLFRLFDITKPLFIGWVDKKVENAFGVMFDDILAGLCAGLCLYILSLLTY